MSFRVEHELHGRRKGRNIGLGLTLAALIAIVFGMTIVKVSTSEFDLPRAQVEEN
ncbi:hypothetical protein [Lacimonas salitolerans]|uniref:Cytochrome C oxidase assembly protein n=1 Tax=Lacimonas salitolerans TaxID=1323750 RepID=A0ABW4EFD1_9RHOB